MLRKYSSVKNDIKNILVFIVMMAILISRPSISVAAGGSLSVEVYKERLMHALDRVSRRTPDKARRHIEFGANLFIAHEVWIESVPQEALIKAVDAFKEAGVDRVDINPGLFPWIDNNQTTIAKYDAVIERIRKQNLKLNLNPQYSPTKHPMNSFSEWHAHAVTLYAELAKRYQPDTFVVIHEPSTMSSRLKKKVGISEWVSFVRQTAKIVRENSPKTRIGVGCLASEKEYFYAFLQLPEIEVFTLDIYSIRDLKIYNEMIRAAQAKGKSIYIEETWRPPYFQLGPNMTLDAISLQNVGNQKFEAIDSQWLRTMTAYAQANHLEAITPIWMFTFFKYVENDGDLDHPVYNRAVVDAILKDERTSTFFTLQKLIQNNQYLLRLPSTDP